MDGVEGTPSLNHQTTNPNHQPGEAEIRGWTKSCTILKPWETIVGWYLQRNHHSRVSKVVQNWISSIHSRLPDDTDSEYCPGALAALADLLSHAQKCKDGSRACRRYDRANRLL